jgi:hypothetical protein
MGKVLVLFSRRVNESAWVNTKKENILLTEQQFGLFEGRDWDVESLGGIFPHEVRYYQVSIYFMPI